MRLQKSWIREGQKPRNLNAWRAFRQRARRYRLSPGVARWCLGCLALSLALLSACASGPESGEGGAQSAESSNLSAAEVLFEALEESVEEVGPGVDVSSAQQLLVVSQYEDLSADRRRRLVARVVPVGRGVGVRVVAEYQSRVEDDEGAQRWELEPREQHADDAERWEISVARDAERRFHRRR